MLLAKSRENLHGIVTDGRQAQAPGLNFFQMTLQFDQLRLAVGSPIGRTDKDQHGALRPHDGIQISRSSVLIPQAETGYVLTHLRSELGYVDFFWWLLLSRKNSLAKRSRDQGSPKRDP